MVPYNRFVEAERVYQDLIWQDPDRMSGAVCFFGTRIPVSTLFEYLEAGDTVESFSEDFRIPPETAKRVLQLAQSGIERVLQDAA